MLTCGRFLCALCDVSLNGQHLCPACLEKGRTQHKIKNLENHRTCYDTIALLVATVSILIYWFTIFTAPLVIFLAVRHWKSPFQRYTPDQDPLHIGFYYCRGADCRLDFIFFQAGAVHLSLIMADKVKEYTKLPGSKKGFFIGKYSLWQGTDHLLHIFARFGIEDYKRFYFSDIQAIITRKTNIGKIQNVILGCLILLFLLPAFIC